jgi:hypothetical protein
MHLIRKLTNWSTTSPVLYYVNVDTAEYRASIAQIVMSDFESELIDINNIIRNAESFIVETACKLTIDEGRCRRIC